MSPRSLAPSFLKHDPTTSPCTRYGGCISLRIRESFQRVLTTFFRERLQPTPIFSSGITGEVPVTPGAARDPSWTQGQWKGDSTCSQSEDFEATVGIFNETMVKLFQGKFQPLTAHYQNNGKMQLPVRKTIVLRQLRCRVGWYAA